MCNLDDLITALAISINQKPLLQLALTHRSWINEHTDEVEDNERLEFLGDAVLDLVVGAYLFKRFPEMQEGELTSLRAALVRSETLADFARQVDINSHLRLGYGEGEHGGREKNATLCAAFEAVIGAIYLDQGIAVVESVIERFIEPMLDIILAQSLHKDAKSEFQMFSQATLNATPTYEVIGMEGPDHLKVFTVQVIVEDKTWGAGSGTSKRRAEQAAAREALIEAKMPGWDV